MTRSPLSREEVVKAIEQRRPSRVPMMIHHWNGAKAFGEREREVLAIQAEYPHDMFVVSPRIPPVWDDPAEPNRAAPGYAWLTVPRPAQAQNAVGYDANVGIRDWGQLDDILSAFPDPAGPHMWWGPPMEARKAANGRYVVFHWWYGFYERLWSLRGMENVLCDFYEHPHAVHCLLDALCDFYCTWIRRAALELQADAIWATDDIGMQTGPMFGPDIFREFFLPRYARLIRAAHDHRMHFWLHTCGDVTLFLDDFVKIGLDVIHPIQKYAMDEREVAARFGGRLCFWAGMDVQQILPKGSPEDVRREVRFMIDTYDRPDGGCMITAGNGVTADVPIDNLRAFYDETYAYGAAHRRSFGAR